MNEHQHEMEQLERDIQFYETHREELLDQYPEQWVAILNEEVVGASSDVHQLIKDIRREGVPTEWTLIRHLTRQEEMLILPS